MKKSKVAEEQNVYTLALMTAMTPVGNLLEDGGKAKHLGQNSNFTPYEFLPETRI